MTYALTVSGWLAFALVVAPLIGMRAHGWVKRNSTQLLSLASNSIDAADLPVVDHEEFPSTSVGA